MIHPIFMSVIMITEPLLTFEPLTFTLDHSPQKVRGHVVEWAELHKDELLGMWNSNDFHKIEPLV